MKINHRLTDKGLNFNSEYPFCDTPYDFILDPMSINVRVDFNELYKIDILEEWNEIFRLKPPIEYETSLKAAGVSRQYHDGTVKEYPNRNTMVSPQKARAGKFSETLHIVPTGYVIPKYEFIGQRLYRRISHMFENNEIEKAYKDALDLFRLKEDNKITVTRYTDVGNYRNILHSQIDRQAKKILNILPSVAHIFKIHYFETERAITNAKIKAQSDTEIDSLNSDLKSIQDGLVSLFQKDIQSGTTLEKLVITEDDVQSHNDHSGGFELNYERFLLAENKYVPDSVMKKTLSGFYSFINEMESIRDIAVILAGKIEPLESILEDFLMGRKIKSIEEYIYSKRPDIQQPETHSGRHKKNKKWILKTFYEQVKLLEVEDQAVKETEVLYEMEFNKPIHPSTIRRYIKKDRESKNNS